MQFVPDESQAKIKVPYLEDARKDFAPNYSSKRTETQAKAMITTELAKLGGGITTFSTGKYTDDDGRKRYGYEIRFLYSGATGIIRVAGLPVRNKTEARKKQAKVQALMNVYEWLRTAVTSQVFAPGNNPLLPHLLLNPGEEKEMTVGEYIQEFKGLPEQKNPLLIESEIVED